MGKIKDAIEKAQAGDIGPLLEAMEDLPSRIGPKPNPMGDDYSDPIPGESFDDVTTAWMDGDLSDETYEACIAATRARRGGTGGG